MWRDALERHQAGRIRATEVRGSDYLEANSLLAFSLAKPLLAGRRGYVPAALDAPHTWTSITDVARTLVTVAGDERGHGRAWLVPSNPPMTVRQLAARFTQVMGAPEPKLSRVPYPMLWGMGLFSPLLRELRATHYQFARPFVLDASSTETTFGVTPSDLGRALATAGGAATMAGSDRT
jgi:nucleoside-diphosphate-sugar epimerase